MTPQRWSEVKAPLHQALERPANERRRFLDQACGADAELRGELDSLIAAYDSDPYYIESPPSLGGGDLASLLAPGRASEFDRPGRVGAYTVLREIGSGGMGVVFLGARADDAYHKQVAIKLIRADALTDPRRRDELVRRLRNERQTLARLEHPNIARLLDGGATEQGQAYLVMEHVEGQPIDLYCRERGLSVAQKLALFQKVCAAVHYAHQNLIVHRDLKPGNMLVTRDGEPKLLDFGTAKALEPHKSSLAAGLTLTGLTPLTPAYASPEQARGEPVTTSSDVYSLGVILYELLTGQRPYRLAGLPPHDVVRVICEQAPLPPSAALIRREPADASAAVLSRRREDRPERIRRRLAGDIDMIALKALRKEPQRRYASVEQFAEDIRRHLVGLPVTARRDTLAYRAAKFARRHKLGVSGSALMALTLVTATLTTTWQATLAREQRDVAEEQRSSAEQARLEAQREADVAQQVTDYLVEVFRASDPFTSPRAPNSLDRTAGELLARGVAQIQEGLGSQPEVQARLLHTLGGVYRNLAAFDEARRLLERALEIRRGLYGAEHLEVAASAAGLGSLLRQEGAHDASAPLLEEALTTRVALLGPIHALVAETLHETSRLEEARGNLARADSLYQQTIATYQRLDKPPARQLADALADHAGLLTTLARLDEADPALREAVDRLRTIHGDNHPEVAAALIGRGNRFQARRDYASAEPLYREALAIYQATLNEAHPFVAIALTNLAGVLEAQGDAPAAVPLHRQALAALQAAQGEQSPQVASALNNLAMALQRTGEIEEAERLFREALGRRRTALGDAHPLVAVSLNNLGLLLFRSKRVDEAGELFREALENRRANLGLDHPKTLESLGNLCVALREGERFEALEPYLLDLLDAQRERASAGEVARTLCELGAARLRLRRPEGAREPLEEAVVLLDDAQADDPRPLALAEGMLGECLTALQSYDEAESVLIRSYDRLRAAGEDQAATSEARERLARLFDARGQPERAAALRAGGDD